MNFTDPLPYKCAEYSHNGYFLAIAHKNELTIYDSDKFTREQNFVFQDAITNIAWSPDDNFILSHIGKKQEVHVRCFSSEVVENQDEGWTATLSDHVGGIEAVIWAPDSRQLMTYATNNIRVSIWSLVT